jgi:hypothetical protein
VTAAASRRRLEQDPGFGDATGLGSRLGWIDHETSRRRVSQGLAQEIGDARGALDGLEVPAERDEVAPEAVRREQAGRGVDVARRERRLESPEPCVHANRCVAAELCAFRDAGHVVSPR